MIGAASRIGFMLIATLVFIGTGCSSNASLKQSSKPSSKEAARLATLERAYKADQTLIKAAMMALQKEDNTTVIAKKKAWIKKRREQQAIKKRKLLQARKHQLAQLRKQRGKSFSSHHQPKTRKVAWRTNHPHALTGDYASNSTAQSFIKRMSRSYNMDHYYLNNIFSQARNLKLARLTATPKKSQKRKTYSRMGRWSRYRRYFITPRHVNGGVNFWKRYSGVLNKAYQQYGVPPEYIVGILGVETIYGGNVGKTRVLDSLSTKAFHRGRRKKFFSNELEKFLLMAQSEGLNPTSLMGSSAGAVGLCQFMPSNFRTLGVDYNRNGSCNLWDPVDAIGSVANYFSKHGWRRGGPVAVRARAEGSAYKKLRSGYKQKYSLKRLASKGITPQGKMDSTVRFLRMSTNAGDEVWLGGHNFYVITRYNHSDMYALAVHQLAQEVKRRYQGNVRVASR